MLDEDQGVSRRAILRAAFLPVLIGAISNGTSWAAQRSRAFEDWQAALLDLNASVRRGTIRPDQWLAQIESLNAAISLDELTRSLDIERATRAFGYANGLTEFAPLSLPALAGEKPDGWMLRAAANRDGGHQMPHVHNNWVETHLILAGGFRLRTYDRVLDMDDAVLLKPVADRRVGPGGLVMMSENRENCHWMTAEGGRAMNICITVMEVPRATSSVLRRSEHFFVDPTQGAQLNGTILAPVLKPSEALRRFG